MSIWIPLVVLIAALLVGIPFADNLGVPPVAAASAATVTAASAITVLVMLGLHTPVFAEPGWPAWLILLGPTVTMALVGAGAALFTPRRPATPVGRCVYCDLRLFVDRTGRRHVADDASYLCPPEHRHPDHQRHSLAVTGRADIGRS